MRFRRQSVCVALLPLLCVVTCPDASAQRYRLVEVDVPPDHQYADFAGLNDSGQVLARAVGFSGSNRHNPAYIWTDGRIEILPFLDNRQTEWSTVPRDLNNRGEAVGTSSTQPQGHAVLWRKVNERWTVIDLHPSNNAEGSDAWSLNDEALVVALWYVPFGPSSSYLWENGQHRDLPDASYYAVNNRRQVCGSHDGWAVLWENGFARTLPQLRPDGSSRSARLNDRGDVVGTFISGEFPTAALWLDAPRPVINVGALDARFGGSAIDINDDREIVGNMRVPNAHVGFVWRGHVMHNLNDLLLDGASTEWHVIRAWRINDSGQIGTDVYNKVRNQNVPARLDPVDVGLTIESFLPNEPGRRNRLTVVSATPGGRVALVAGTARGEVRNVPQCPGARIELANPTLVGTAMADATGRASFVVTIPLHFAGQRAVVQAIDLTTCEVSPPGFIQFQDL